MVKIKEKVILFFSNYLPLQIWTLKICIHAISKIITVRPKKINVLFPETSEYFLGSVGRQFFLF